MVKNHFKIKIILYPDPHSDLYKNLLKSSLSHTQPAHQISSWSVHNFFRYPAHKQTDKQTTRKRCRAEHNTCKIHHPLQRLPWIHQIVHFIQIKIDNLNQSSGQSDENWWFFRLKLMILEVWPWVDLWPFDLRNSWFPDSVTQYANPVQLSSQMDEKMILEIWRQDDLSPQNQSASQLRLPLQRGKVSWRSVSNSDLSAIDRHWLTDWQNRLTNILEKCSILQVTNKQTNRQTDRSESITSFYVRW